MNNLPIELLHRTARVDAATYRVPLSCPRFARNLDYSIVVDYLLMFGYGVTIVNDGIKFTLDDKPHRTGGPAIEYTSGARLWFLCREMHRLDRSAMELSDGERRWYQNGNLHREDGPAIEFAGGARWWYFDGQLHREDSPAVEERHMCMRYHHGKLHREDGPAVERVCGAKE